MRLADGHPVVRRAAIHALVMFHLLAVAAFVVPTAPRYWTLWRLPWVPPLHRAIQDALQPYMRFVGLTQTWRMFAHPPTRCTHLEAEVIFADGTRTTWSAPLMHRLGLWERYGKERYRKWVENVIGSRDDRLRADAARYVARQFADRASPPVTVHLILRWADLELARSPSGQVLDTAILDRRISHAHPFSEVLFRYAVRLEDLR